MEQGLARWPQVDRNRQRTAVGQGRPCPQPVTAAVRPHGDALTGGQLPTGQFLRHRRRQLGQGASRVHPGKRCLHHPVTGHQVGMIQAFVQGQTSDQATQLSTVVHPAQHLQPHLFDAQALHEVALALQPQVVQQLIRAKTMVAQGGQHTEQGQQHRCHPAHRPAAQPVPVHQGCPLNCTVRPAGPVSMSRFRSGTSPVTCPSSTSALARSWPRWRKGAFTPAR
jgi:hypothetical protein